MPLFQFFCRKCEKPFEVFLHISEVRKGSVCPYCQGKDSEALSETERADPEHGVSQTVCGVKEDT